MAVGLNELMDFIKRTSTITRMNGDNSAEGTLIYLDISIAKVFESHAF